MPTLETSTGAELLSKIEGLEETVVSGRETLMNLLRVTADNIESTDDFKGIKKKSWSMAKDCKKIIDTESEIRKIKALAKKAVIRDKGLEEIKHLEEQARLKPSDQDAWTKTRLMFEDMLEGMRVNFENSRKNFYLDIKSKACKYVGMGNKEKNEEFKAVYGKDCYYNPCGEAREIDHMLTEDDSVKSHWSNRTLCLIEDITAYIEKRIAEDVASMFSAFISKNTQKVANILKGRGLEVTGKFHNINLECDLDFVLDDGARFHMKSQIIWKYSVNNLLFWQFPSTFSEAYKADGTKIQMASEAKLKIKL